VIGGPAVDPAHSLEPLLRPGSIALLGASDKPNSAGRAMVEMSRIDGYAGAVFPVNPGYDAIAGLRCFPSLDALPQRVEHVVLGVGSARLEAALDEAIAHGARAATIFASGHSAPAHGPSLAERLAAKATSAGLALCGTGSMGFYNRTIGLRIAAFPSPPDLTAGGIVWISQSGSVFSALAHNDRRLGFALAVSSGMETTTTVADYIGWSLRQPETRVIGLFLEGVRDPERLRAALEAAAERAIPVVALKVGRTQRSASMAATHTGALSGNDAAWRALFRSIGVCAVSDLDELAASLQLFEQPRRIGAGALAAMHDSGGERELLVDLAEELRVPFATIGERTKATIAANLEPGLAPENPLDSWGTGKDYVARSAECLTALLDDPATSLAISFSDPRDEYWYATGVADAVRRASRRSGKPVALASNTALTKNAKLAQALRRDGIPLLIGIRPALLAVRNALAHRDAQDRRATPAIDVPDPMPVAAEHWRARLSSGRPLLEAEALDLLSAYCLSTPARCVAHTPEEAIAAADRIGYPIALKTAEGHPHKTDMRGVVLGVPDRDVLARSYADLSGRLGPRVLMQAMAEPGVEIALGAIDDPQFGPFVMIAAGGAMIELIGDTAVALAPFGALDADRLLSELKVTRMLRGWRGSPPADRRALSTAIARFSRLAADLAGSYAQIDVNPVIAGPGGAIAVDALVISSAKGRPTSSDARPSAGASHDGA
jgi:acetate---CoA ligase (ADP-forming)